MRVNSGICCTRQLEATACDHPAATASAKNKNNDTRASARRGCTCSVFRERRKKKRQPRPSYVMLMFAYVFGARACSLPRRHSARARNRCNGQEIITARQYHAGWRLVVKPRTSRENAPRQKPLLSEKNDLSIYLCSNLNISTREILCGKKKRKSTKRQKTTKDNIPTQRVQQQQSRLLIVRPAGKEDRRIKAAGADPGPGRSRRARLPRGSFPPFPLNPPPADGVRALSGRKNSRRVNTGRERRDKTKIFFGFGLLFSSCVCLPTFHAATASSTTATATGALRSVPHGRPPSETMTQISRRCEGSFLYLKQMTATKKKKKTKRHGRQQRLKLSCTVTRFFAPRVFRFRTSRRERLATSSRR